MSLADDSLIRRLLVLVKKYDLDRRDFVIFGSAPLLAHGLRVEIKDLDVVARGAVWERVVAYGCAGVGEINGARLAVFYEGSIQFSRGWISDDWDADDLIDGAEIVEGLPFASLGDVLRYKRTLQRPKDQRDIGTLERLVHPASAS